MKEDTIKVPVDYYIFEFDNISFSRFSLLYFILFFH